MEVEEYIRLLMEKNPALNKADDEVVSLKARGLRAIIRQAYQKGFEAATPNPYPPPAGGSSNSGSGADLFNQLFGNGLRP